MTDPRVKKRVSDYGTGESVIADLHHLYGGNIPTYDMVNIEFTCTLLGADTEHEASHRFNRFRGIDQNSPYAQAVHEAAHAKFSTAPDELIAEVLRNRAGDIFMTLEDARVGKLMGEHLDMDLPSAMSERAKAHYFGRKAEHPGTQVYTPEQSVVNIAYGMEKQNETPRIEQFEERFAGPIQEVVEQGSELDASVLALKIADYLKWEKQPPFSSITPPPAMKPGGQGRGNKGQGVPPPQGEAVKSYTPSSKPTYKQTVVLRSSLERIKAIPWESSKRARHEVNPVETDQESHVHYWDWRNSEKQGHGNGEAHRTQYIHALNTIPFEGRYGATLFTEAFGSKDKEITVLDVTGIITEDAWRLNLADMEVFNPEVHDMPFINIMVDLSGSMGEPCRGHRDSPSDVFSRGHVGNITDTKSNGQLAWDVVNILQDNFPEAKTYGFTTTSQHYIMEYNRGQQPTCWHKTHDVQGHLLPTDIPAENTGKYGVSNADCTALLYLARQTSFMPGSISIMISDGQPADGGECDPAKHTYDLAHTMRDMGMKFGHVLVDVLAERPSSSLYPTESEVVLHRIEDIYKMRSLVDWVQRRGD